MSFNRARGEHSHFPGGETPPCAPGVAVARPNRVITAFMASPLQYHAVPCHYEYRQVLRIFLAGLGLSFAFIGAVAALSAGPALPTKMLTGPAGIVLPNNPVEARAKVDQSVTVQSETRLKVDAKSAAAVALSPRANVPDVAQQSSERSSKVASLQLDTPHASETNSVLIPAHPSHTAVYDIAAHIVYMPNGQVLVAHSGLGSKLDDPRYVKAKDRGPTPPNVYELTLRQKLFHNVRAIRLIPVGDGNMFGRNGMLAHSYMLGADGQSNGCVSFKDYPAFLQAFRNGEVDRFVVVPKVDVASWLIPGAVLHSQFLDIN